MAREMQRLFTLYTIIHLITCVAGQDMKNITITVPLGASYSRDSNLLCTPIKWYQIVIFVFANYISHAATVRTHPGEKPWSICMVVVVALLLPYSGLARGLSAIRRHAIFYGPLFGGSDLRMAARAQALCVVSRRQGWKPCMARQNLSGIAMYRKETTHHRYDPGGPDSITQEWDEVHYYRSFTINEKVTNDRHQDAFLWVNYNSSRVGQVFGDRAIYGCHLLPVEALESYGFAILPEDAEVNPIDTEQLDHGVRKGEFAIPSTIDTSSAVVAIVQIVFATLTLYKTRGNQIDRFGYAAFGLTVLPYLLMSFVNLLGNILTPKYPGLFMIRSPEMEEAEVLGGVFEGVVGVVNSDIKRGVSAKVDATGEILEFSQLPVGVSIIQKDGSGSSQNNHPLQPSNTTNGYRFRVEVPVDEPADGIGISIPSASAFKLRPIPPKSAYFGTFATAFFLLIPTIAPFAVNGGLTSFHDRNSTYAQRVWIMVWQVFGIVLGYIVFFIAHYSDARSSFNKWGAFIGCALIFGVPSIGGFVVVGQMLKAFGHCVEIGQ